MTHWHKPQDPCHPDCPPLDWPALVERLSSLLRSAGPMAGPEPSWFSDWSLALDISQGYLQTARTAR